MQIFIYILVIIFLFFLFLLLLEEILIKLRGDCDVSIEKPVVKKIDSFIKDEHTLVVTTQFLFINTGKQQGLIIDCVPSLNPTSKDYKDFIINIRIKNTQNPRTDGYWEGFILKEHKKAPVEIILEITSPTLQTSEILSQLKELSVKLNYKYYGRTPLIYKQELINLNLSGLILDKKWIEEEIVFKPKLSSTPDRIKPIKTHLLKPGEDIVEIIKKYTPTEASSGDIIAIAESALAIIQGRFKYIEDIKPRFLARKINKLFDKDSSLSSVYSLEMAFREVGALKILLAVFIGFATKLIGIKGGFYRTVGKKVTAIDDCTGTIPPYDKYVVLTPANLKETVNYLKTQTGFNIAIVDVNDLKRVDILASTCPEYEELINKALVDNPQGNANEQTPLVLIKI